MPTFAEQTMTFGEYI